MKKPLSLTDSLLQAVELLFQVFVVETFADYMGRGKRQPYAEWVKEYVGEN